MWWNGRVLFWEVRRSPSRRRTLCRKQLQADDELSLARSVLAQLRKGTGLLDQLPADRRSKEKLCQQEALLTSKDPEIELGRSSRPRTRSACGGV